MMPNLKVRRVKAGRYHPLSKGAFAMLSPRQLLMIPLLAAAVAVGLAPNAWAQQIFATAQTIQVVEGGAYIDAQFRITVTNGESVVASNVRVGLEDGTLVYVGDVPAGGSADSAPQSRNIDISTQPSRSIPVQAFMTFQLDGVSVGLDQVFLVFRPAPAGEGL